MERSYPKRFNKPSIHRHLDLLAGKLGCDVFDVDVAEEPDPARFEPLLVDDASLLPAGMTDDPGLTAGVLGSRADVVYVDEEFGIVRFSGPIADRRRGGPSSPDALPLPVLLWRAGVEPGVWVAVSECPLDGGEDRAATLVRVTDALLQRGRRLSEAGRNAKPPDRFAGTGRTVR